MKQGQVGPRPARGDAPAALHKVPLIPSRGVYTGLRSTFHAPGNPEKTGGKRPLQLLVRDHTAVNLEAWAQTARLLAWKISEILNASGAWQRNSDAKQNPK